MNGFVAALIVLLVSPTLAFAQLRGVKADLAPLVESDARVGSNVRALVHVRVPEGFHLQSNAPRDPSLIPTVLTFAPPTGVRVMEVVFPKATDFTLEGQAEPLAVFEHEFVVGVQFAVASDVATGALDVPARFRYQACDDKLCFAPVSVDLQWTLRVVSRGATVSRQQSELFARIAFDTGTPPPDSAIAALAPLPAPTPTTPGTTATLDDFSVVASTGGYLRTAAFLTFVQNAEHGITERGLFEGRGPLAILLIVFLGGLALNLTPCVLPMIPINLAIIGAGAKAGSRARGFLLGGVYGSAMALVYGILGVVVILTAGTFGTINASPWFNASIALVFIVLALAMFDVVTIDLSRFSSSVGAGGAGRGSLALAFGMGAIAALLAGACVAPVVIQVVLFSSNLYAQGTVIALGLPFLLGIGMAIPWPLAGAGLTALPRPGAWMVRVKQAFGVLILVTAAYYGYLAYTLFADRWVDAGEVTSSVDAMVKDGWHSSLEEGLAIAEREQKPVLIDMWATWCKNCLTMDKTTLADSAVKAALNGYVKVKFQAEQPDEQPARAVMERFHAIGLPTYVILRPAERRRD
jgi:cytochrome c biogenesis protein CcdA/thiol-disulfide isomerase/thioredoxin